MQIQVIVTELNLKYEFDLMKWEEEGFKYDLYKLVSDYKGRPKQYPNDKNN